MGKNREESISLGSTGLSNVGLSNVMNGRGGGGGGGGRTHFSLLK